MATYKDDLDILKAAEKDANKLSLNAITELDNKGLLGMYGGGGGKAIPDEFGLMIFLHSETVPVPEWGEPGKDYHPGEYIAKDFNYVSSKLDTAVGLVVGYDSGNDATIAVGRVQAFAPVNGAYSINSFVFLPSGEIYNVIGGK